jgi:preprotein translocase subunit Sec61beta
MAQDQKMQMPGVFGGLMRYGDEYKSKFIFTPQAVMAFVVAIIAFVLVLKIFFPVAG